VRSLTNIKDVALYIMFATCFLRILFMDWRW